MLNVGSTQILFTKAEIRKGNMRIENIPANRYAVTVTVTRRQWRGGYKSGLIDPGYFMEYVKLDKNLPGRAVSCKATFTAYDQDSKKEIGTAGVRINILVKN